MKPPLKLNSIDKEHLQELYDTAKVARDDLPYSSTFDEMVQGFQDRTFKNADHEQVFGALLKYARTGSVSPSADGPAVPLNDDQVKQIKVVLSRHASGGKLLPYSDEFKSARAEYIRLGGADITEHDFWRACLRAGGSKRRPPPPRKKAVAAAAEDDEE